ncbi:L-idonate 5-dehydrogenase [Rathayibacter rathayi]|uniref:L-idonate 5-dehydrogenase n=1 Tax=Rathayibacter rathayi TaxID=33887 RepID=A0ABX5A8K4_RATRA|nr:L-idonate 5-dehydrogenase [Rathayibacter rathayi]AZZ50246.1 L-idonate 5-dehydrogenase [Rathayibacter rathayi]MWV74460.1 zinc-binding dehydrogenase [Rathayibacter rathayi NCPPB 2980 = VKM Ac-1601]PPF46452.1 L-idonate 5-dehydrogenase [Rathayibacter rathayi]PPF75318.1 L-idonate 5-dehydrogenase [Rathayibacter rathayi]PPG10047.1 L-idonate 5-dehydrogenase [Rathayibacter rathayi]
MPLSLPASTTRVVVHAAGDLRVEEAPLPARGPSDALVAVAYGGICGSDLHYWTHGAAGESILREPLTLGHEVVGTVVEAAADGTGPATGTAVAVHPATAHGEWPDGRPNLATEGTYLGSAARMPHTQGAFARHAVLPARMLRQLPPGLWLREAALAEPASVAWHAVSRAGAVSGRRALVIGSGPIGALIVAVLKRAGAAEIVAVDLAEEPLAIARAVGATRTIRATDADAIAEVAADVVFESSGSPRGLMSAVRGAARGCTVVMVGLLPSGEQPALISLAITRELRLIGSFRFVDELDEVLAALADGSLEVEPVVTQVLPLERAVEAFELARDASRSSKVLLDFTS